jgi:tetratricopeptide (TPR) repeat protein
VHGHGHGHGHGQVHKSKSQTRITPVKYMSQNNRNNMGLNVYQNDSVSGFKAIPGSGGNSYGMCEFNDNLRTYDMEVDEVCVGNDFQSNVRNPVQMGGFDLCGVSQSQNESAFEYAQKLHALGYKQRKLGAMQQALQFYSAAIHVYPNFFKAFFNRGFAYDKIGEYALAIKDYSKAIQLRPDNPFCYYNRGISLDRIGKFDQAIENFTNAISIMGDKPDFYHNRGFAYRKKKDFINAIKDYTQAVKINPNHFKVILFFVFEFLRHIIIVHFAGI